MHCKECRWWKYSHSNSIPEGINIKKMGTCNNPKCGYVLPETFGCVHFEEKKQVIVLKILFDKHPDWGYLDHDISELFEKYNYKFIKHGYDNDSHKNYVLFEKEDCICHSR
jgi:hypothetical protein